MKHLTGQFISELGSLLHSAARYGQTSDQLKKNLNTAVDAYFNLSEPSLNESIITLPLTRATLSNADSEELQRLSSLLPWSTYSAIGEIPLGNIYNHSKRHKCASIPDDVCVKLDQAYPLSDAWVIESGCFEGIHSISMAMLGAKVHSFDARIENVVKSLVRAWAYGLEHKIQFDLVNLELPNALNIYKKMKTIDLYHCRGVLYHLKDPVRYLQEIADLSPRAIYIHSQVASNGQANIYFESEIGPFRVFKYREGSRQSPFAGVDSYALWLEPESVKKILADFGYSTILIEHLKQERNGDRLELLVSR